MSNGNPICSEPSLYLTRAGGNGAFFAELIQCQLPISSCKPYLFGSCPRGGGSRDGRRALFLLLFSNVLERMVRLQLIQTGFLSRDPRFLKETPDEIREAILTRGAHVTLEQIGLECDDRMRLIRSR